MVSALVTSYNREKYIAAAFESVRGQTFTDFVVPDWLRFRRELESARGK